MNSETPGIVTAPPEESIREISRRLRGEEVGCVVVVEEGKPVGIITDRDIAIQVVREQRDPETTRAGDLINDELITEIPGTSSFELLRIMRENKIRRIPLVEGDKLVDLVTMDALMVKLTDDLKKLADVLEPQSLNRPLDSIG